MVMCCHLDLTDLDWPSWIQAMCAVAMAVFAGLMFMVSDNQRQIMLKQQALQEQNNRLSFELERGRMYCSDAWIESRKLCFRFTNTGRYQLETISVEFEVFDERRFLSSLTTQLQNPTIHCFRRFVLAGESFDSITHVRDLVEIDSHVFNKPMYIACRAVYTTLATRRLYEWAWVFAPDGPAAHEGRITGSRWVGREYERDVPCPKQPSDPQHWSSTSAVD